MSLPSAFSQPAASPPRGRASGSRWWVALTTLLALTGLLGATTAAQAVTHTITATAAAGGSIAPSGLVVVTEGNDQPFAITADPCFVILDVLVDGVSVGAVSAYTFTNVQADHTIDATFVAGNTPTSTAIADTPSPSVCQQDITLTATITPSTATGSVEFFDGATSLGTAPVASGSAQLIVSGGLAVGGHTLSAVYTATGCYNGSTSPNKAHTVNKAQPGISVTSDINPSSWSQAVTFTATLSSAPGATGSITFKDSLTTLGVVAVSGGQAQFIKSNLYTGKHTAITASYSGDGCFKTATSPLYAQLVYRATTSSSLVSDINPSTFGQNVKFTATVTPVGVTGRVTFYDGATPIGTANVNGSGVATLFVSNLAPGTHAMTISYPGDSHYDTNTSPIYSQVVNQQTSTTSLATSPNPSVCQQAVTLTATVTPSDASGTVEFFDGINSLGTAPVSSGQAQLVVSSLTVGTHTIGATYGGDTFYSGSTASNVSQVVNKAQPTLTLTTNPNPSVWNQTVTLTATASSSAATGTVTFKDSLTTIGTAPMVSGVAQMTKSNFNPGNHTALTAVYAGNACFKNATSPPASQLVYRGSTTLTLTSDINPSTFGQNVKLTATISPIGPTGRITFYDEGNPIGTGALSAATGIATLYTSNLAPGSHNLTASYPGDVHYHFTVTLTPYVQVVSQQASSTALAVSPSPSTCQAPTTLTATITPSNATGTVEFFDGASSLGTSAVSSGVATLITTALLTGSHTMGATYSGDTYYLGSSAPTQALTVNKTQPGISVTSDINPSSWSQPVTFTATLSNAAGATGSITFKDSLSTLGVVAVSGGQAQFIKSNLYTGNHTAITASYSGDGCYKTATSAPYSQLVYRASSSASLVSDINPSAFGQNVKFTATVSPVGVTGRVTFYDGATPIGTGNVNASGVATLYANNLVPGTHAMTVSYPGDSHYQPSTSPIYNQVVNQLTSSTSLATAPNPSVCQQPVTLTATVTPSDASGTVEFFDGINSLGTAPVSSGQAQLVVSSLTVGTHTIGATYSGDTYYSGSTASNVSQVVNKAQPTLTLTTNPNPSVWNQTVTLTATASSSAATGTVTFKDSLTTIGTAPMVSGVAQMTKSNFNPGNHTTLTAIYAGDACFKNATSAPASQLVYRGSTVLNLTSDINPSAFGQNVKLTATISPIGPTGRITFYDEGTPIGTGGLNAATGIATLYTSNLAPGSHNLTASYPGDVHYHYTVTLTPYVQVVNTGATSVALTSDVNPSAVGQKVNFTATVTPAGVTGTVEFFDGASSLGTSPVDGSGLATLSTTTLLLGSHSMTATYSGDPYYAGSTSPAYSQDVVAALLQQGTVAALRSVVTKLGTETTEFGVRVSWAVSNRAVFASLELQRAATEDGPWIAVNAPVSEDAGLMRAEDNKAQSGARYFYRLVGTTPTAQQAIFGPVAGTAGAPTEFALRGTFPNPSAGPLTVQFTVAKAANVKLSIVDLLGRQVSVLAEGAYTPGRYQVNWDGRSDHGQVPAGVYFVQYVSPGKRIVNRVTIAR